MGEARRKKQTRTVWPDTDSYRGTIDLHVLPPVATINGARIRELTGDDTIPDATQVILRAFRSVVGQRSFHVGFCLGDGEAFSAIGIAVIERLTMEAPAETALHVVPVVHEDIAWDIVMRHLRSFTGQVLLFAFSDSDIYDAGTAPIFHSKHIRQFSPEGEQYGRLTDTQRRRILEQKASILDRPLPKFYAATGTMQEDTPWIFRIATPAGKVIRTAVWDGRRSYAHEMPADIARWVGGDRIAIVQVDSPVGVNRRSSLDLTHFLAKDFDGVIHWARDTETFQSILKSFIRLDLDSVSPPDLAQDWTPEIVILPANGLEKP